MKGQVGSSRVVTLYVQGITLDDLSLEDIGRYLADFADLLGKDVEPKFHSIKKTGSFSLRAKVPAEREIDVKTRGFLLRTGDAPEEAVRARERIAQRLGINRAKRATLLDSRNSKVIEIPVEKPVEVPPKVPGFMKGGSLQGRIIQIGGKRETVSVEIQDVDSFIYLCKASRDVARKLARDMFDPIVRVYGAGRWHRTDEGVWRVEDFQIARHEVLEDLKFDQTIAELRAIPAEWKRLEDPHAELKKIQNGE
ncbi:conserved hypothetical protein [Candidatus Sulfopaludibacter sp. SbA6]|nr:conserved hypothetical protein [Candidatus Sulfopaludibacter sp. SbA6]